MRDIYLIDFENVASEGLSGITYLAPEDEVIIFYSNNSNRLSMKMHILIGKSVCKLDYFEVTVGGKNALDHQISTWLGYLVGTHAADRNYYIVSRDMGYKFVASFWAESELKPNVRCVENIRAAGRAERHRMAREAKNQEPPAMLKSPEPVLQLAPASQSAETVEQPAIPAAEPETAEQPAVRAEQLAETAEQPVVPAEQPAETAEQPAIPAAEPETAEQPAEALQVAAPAEQPEPQETAEESQEVSGEHTHSKSYRGRQRYRRSRAKNGRSAVQEGGETARKPESQPEQKPEVKAQPQPEQKPEVKAKPQPEQKPEAKAKPQPEQKPEVKAKPQPEQKPEAKAKPQPEQKPEVKAKPQPEQKPEAKPRQKSGRKPAAEPRRVELGTLLAPYPSLQEQQLQELIAGNKRQILCNTLRKQLGQEKGLALYNEIKKSAWR